MTTLVVQAKTLLDKELDEAQEKILARWEAHVNARQLTEKEAPDVDDTTAMVAWAVPFKIALALTTGNTWPEGSSVLEAQELHITLKYLGDIDANTALEVSRYVESLTHGRDPFELTITGVEKFENVGEDDKQDAIYLSVEAPLLGHIKRQLETDLSHIRVDDYETFTPHITLAYIPHGTTYATSDHVGVNITVNNLTFAYGGVFQRFPFITKILQFKQLNIDDESKKTLIRVRMEIFNDESDALAEQVFNGDITIGQWQEEMKQLVRGLHTSMAAISSGGWDNMSSQAWGRLGTPIREQYRFLKGFAAMLDEKRDVVTLNYIKNRARLYGFGSLQTAVLIETPLYIADLLPWLPKDGSTPCIVNCHCTWELEVIDSVSNFQVVEAIWRLGTADHCEVCLDREGHVEILNVPYDVTIPSRIGGY